MLERRQKLVYNNTVGGFQSHDKENETEKAFS